MFTTIHVLALMPTLWRTLKVGIHKLRKVKELAQGHRVRQQSQTWTWLKSLFIALHCTLRNLKAGTINLSFYPSTCPPSIYPASGLSVGPPFHLYSDSLLPAPQPHQSSSPFYSLAIYLTCLLFLSLSPLFCFLSFHQLIHTCDIY